ncbi:MAG: substrate-binding domain-containing protein [Lachnospiraceae bacterium]|nr:substrate-binding domain-containing protein [Lachnospiraceae bacterium]
MVYFFLTLIVTLLVTLMFPLITWITFLANVPLFVYVPVQLLLSFAVMCGYGYMITKVKHPRKPASMMAIYLPLFLPFIWHLICRGICNIQNLSGSLFEVLLGFVSFHLFGVLVSPQIPGFNQWHSILLVNLFYDCILILGFAAGERLSAKRTEVERKPFAYHKKVIAAVLILVFSAYALSEYVLFKQRENIVESAHPSYNFAYAGGYSSIDLRPYSVENEENILAKLEEPSIVIITDPQEMPIMDGAEAAYPVYSAFANACYENIAEIQEKAGESKDNIMPIQFTNTIYAYEKLLSGEIDIFFGARPSEAQFKMAEEAGVELELTPIGKEAFVFFVNEENPVNTLSSDQLRAIYSGEINNWNKVGGTNQRILAFQRPKNSGSQTMMEYFMGDTPLREPLEIEYDAGMGDIIRDVADYENSASALGYSFRYYTTIMFADTDEGVPGIKLLAVDGVYPDTATIQSGEYPYTTQLYAITVVGRADAKSTLEPFLTWMIGPQGQQIVSDTGYVAIK